MNANFKGNPATNPPATAAEIAALRSELGFDVPTSLQEVWRTSNGLSYPESGVTLYATNDIKERNESYEIGIYEPDFLLIGDDSGGNGFLIDKNEKESKVFKIDFGAIGSSKGEIVAEDLPSWIEQECPVSNIDEELNKRRNIKINIVLNKKPKDGLKGMLLVKQKLNISSSSSELKACMDNVPCTIISQVYLSKYESVCNEINETQDCLIMVPA